jgi:hypothetical protein
MAHSVKFDPELNLFLNCPLLLAKRSLQGFMLTFIIDAFSVKEVRLKNRTPENAGENSPAFPQTI